MKNDYIALSIFFVDLCRKRIYNIIANLKLPGIYSFTNIELRNTKMKTKFSRAHAAQKRACAKCGTFCSIHTGFTLAELLTAVLVISIIMVALAPVITKRMGDNIAVETNRKTGDEIYENPGSYTFDIPIGVETVVISASGGGGGGGGASMKTFEKEFYADTTWTVPQGVFEVTLNLTGGGGAGGNANASAAEKTTCGSLDFDNWPQSAPKIKEAMIVRGADDGRNLCFFTENIDGRYNNKQAIVNYKTLDSSSVCLNDRCCWVMNDDTTKGISACTPFAAFSLCNYYPHSSSFEEFGSKHPERHTYRLPSATEWDYISNAIANAARAGNTTLVKNIVTTLNLKYGGYTTYCSDKTSISSFGLPSGNIIPDSFSGCTGAGGSCSPAQYFRSDQKKNRLGTPYCVYTGLDENGRPGAVRCAKPLGMTNQFSGGGGASGAVVENLRIKVRPGDTLQIKIGKGGTPASTIGGNGNNGAETSITHKTKVGNTAVSAVYKVSGGKGGRGGISSGSGQQGQGGEGNEENSTRTITFSPNTTAVKTEILKSQGTLQYSISGAAGTTSSGGAGAASYGLSGSTKGGYFRNDTSRGWGVQCTKSEREAAVGADALDNTTDRQYGFGGGGGFAPTWANKTQLITNVNTNMCGVGKGGAGGDGLVKIKYTQFTPGGGGGGAATIKDYEYDVRTIPEVGGLSGVRRMYFTVGSGGIGGQAGNNGSDGEETNIMDGTIILYPGKGGKIGKTASGFCSTPSSCQYLGGDGGAGGAIFGNIGIVKGNDGAQGSKNKEISGVQNWDTNGYSGGRGGTTQFESYGGCGGAQNDPNENPNACRMSDDYNGSAAPKHFVNSYGESVNGGQGGGGAGAGGDSGGADAQRGFGGNGANGYVRIKWGQDTHG